ncbi:hypothetical protein [Sulfuricurvum sp.]|uniref:hypothetical protein n=1 Tax=Sulfuricurvum sp. TaxID=2025608 RepID=UPI0019B0AAD7|nr:hypothetical protein [Sulfuricurvum sp.]MBD3798808.1 hypothetical protein [Campylobacterota bacterium]MBD3806104.1 hypothetical protein [Sulfuricurvum sp.]
MERADIASADGGEDLLMRLLILSIALILSGCFEPSTTLPYPLIISQEGLGAIHPKTPIDQIPTLMVGFEVEKLSAVSSVDEATIYQIKRGGTTLAQIVSDKSGKIVDSIHILSPLIKDTHNQTIHEPLKKKPFLCKGERCTDPSSPLILYTIDPKNRTILEITYQRL